MRKYLPIAISLILFSFKNFKNVSLYRNKINIGYEQSLNKGFKLLGNSNFDYIITMDADGEHSVKNVPKIIKFCNRYNFSNNGSKNTQRSNGWKLIQKQKRLILLLRKCS